ncbi:N,N-dimethylformamidase beta subunit family domain-containing protein [Streptacidiphilus jiangxiensis]|uniref:N,N-dimethylformamidase beta subunit family domain-containing protein n=1 Tax=Streptacidiphilus jiangxiensis TaxID=235985 RepID=UPI00116034C5|nr:N,N-dimethylformamidase beta subunit family domain-containing protein [Streptacidiphilus jiangxiensis]
MSFGDDRRGGAGRLRRAVRVERSTGRGVTRRGVLGAAAAAGAVVGVGAGLAGCEPGRSGGSAEPTHGTGAGASASPVATGVQSAATLAENAKPGASDWRITKLGAPDEIEGYTDRASARPGEPLALHVSTTAPGFTVSAYRVGWYGGAQARLVWRSDRIAGKRQPAPVIQSPTRTVRAGWQPSLSLDTRDWPEGAYLLRLDAVNGSQRWVPLILRSQDARGRVLVMHGTATWQAYNTWGGTSLYQGENGSYGSRALKVSFDRPYADEGAEKFLVYERALVVLAERLGLPLAYTSGIDVHTDPSVLSGATAVLSLGHDEYWTPQQRQSVTKARDAGTNIAFLGANTCFRRIRVEDDGRTVVCYKTDYRDDPAYLQDRALTTTDFRSGPAADPESSMTGVLYEGYPTDAPYVVHLPDHWLFEGTGVRAGDSFAHLVGVEYDRVTPSAPTPRPIEILAHSPLVCNGNHSHSDTAYYTARSGAGVFASGTMRWVEGLMAGGHDDGGDHGMDARTAVFVTRTTENLLNAFALGPAANHRPAPKDNLQNVYG